MTARFRRGGCHAAPLHESLPVAWRRLLGPARRLAARTRSPDARCGCGHAPGGHYASGECSAFGCACTPVQPARAIARVQTRLLADEEPEAGPAPAPAPPGPAGTVPVEGPPSTAGTVPLTGWALAPVLYGERGEHPYPERTEDWWSS